MRAEQRRTNMPGETRIYTALRGFTGEGGYPTSAPGMKGVPYEVTTVEQVRKDVDELTANHVDMVKIWVDDHLGRERKIPFDLSKAIIENAHTNHLKVAAHIFYLDDAKALVNVGLDGLAHSVRDKPVDHALIDAMKKRGVYQLPTLTRELSTFVFAEPGTMLNDPYLGARGFSGNAPDAKDRRVPKAGRRRTRHGARRSWYEMAKKNLKTLYDGGVKIGFGTDTGPPRRIQGYFEQPSGADGGGGSDTRPDIDRDEKFGGIPRRLRHRDPPERQVGGSWCSARIPWRYPKCPDDQTVWIAGKRVN